VDPHGRVVSYLLTLFLRSSSQNRSFSRIPFGCRERCGGVLMMGSLPSSSAVSPQRTPSSSNVVMMAQNLSIHTAVPLCKRMTNLTTSWWSYGGGGSKSSSSSPTTSHPSWSTNCLSTGHSLAPSSSTIFTCIYSIVGQV